MNGNNTFVHDIVTITKRNGSFQKLKILSEPDISTCKTIYLNARYAHAKHKKEISSKMHQYKTRQNLRGRKSWSNMLTGISVPFSGIVSSVCAIRLSTQSQWTGGSLLNPDGRLLFPFPKSDTAFGTKKKLSATICIYSTWQSYKDTSNFHLLKRVAPKVFVSAPSAFGFIFF